MMENKTNEDIDLIVNNPKKALKKLSIPVIISNLFMILYNIIDGIWVSGLGPNSLAAVGFITPIFLIIIGVGLGLSAGANSLISRYLGAENYEMAENSAVHSIILSIVVTLAFTIVGLIVLKPLLLIMGAGDVISEAMSYGNIIVLGTYAIFIPLMILAIFRAEGEIKRATYPLIAAAIINVVLDPVFIYVLGLGVGGAALASIVSATIPSLLVVYWMFYKRDSFLKVRMRDYKRDFSIYKDILVVGVPACLEQFVVSLFSILVNYWLSIISGAVAVATYTAAWRLVAIATTPVGGIGMAALTVGGAAYGAKNLVNFKTTLNYGIKIGLVLSVLLSSLLFIFAEPLSVIFSYSQESSVLAPHIVGALRILCFFVLLIPFGSMSCSMFQSMGKGTTSLMLTILRSSIFEILFVVLFAFVLSWGEPGVYIGNVVGANVGAVIAYICLRIYLNRHESDFITE